MGLGVGLGEGVSVGVGVGGLVTVGVGVGRGAEDDGEGVDEVVGDGGVASGLIFAGGGKAITSVPSRATFMYAAQTRAG